MQCPFKMIKSRDEKKRSESELRVTVSAEWVYKYFVSRLESVEIVDRRIRRYAKVVSLFDGGRDEEINLLIEPHIRL